MCGFRGEGGQNVWFLHFNFVKVVKIVFFNFFNVFLLKSWFAVMNLLIFLLPNCFFLKKHVFQHFKVVFIQIYHVISWKNIKNHTFWLKNKKIHFNFVKVVKVVFLNIFNVFLIKVDSRSWIYSFFYFQTVFLLKNMFFNIFHVFLIRGHEFTHFFTPKLLKNMFFNKKTVWE